MKEKEKLKIEIEQVKKELEAWQKVLNRLQIPEKMKNEVIDKYLEKIWELLQKQKELE
jgi:hypothetical protein